MTLPRSVWQGTFRLFGVDLKCHVLEDGQRVVEADSVQELFGAMSNAEPASMTITDAVDEFAKWLHGARIP